MRRHRRRRPVEVPPSGDAAATTMVTPPSTSFADGSGGGALTGTVRDLAGHRVAGAYVIGLESLTVVRTDSTGRFSMPCRLTVNGLTGERAEPLVASLWVLPIEPTGQGSYALGRNTTNYGPPPSTPGLGYAVSGEALDAAHSAVVTCDGHATDFVLASGGAADIRILDASGARLSGSGSGIPPDNLYLPGLGEHAALETAPLSSDGHQLLTHLGAGVLRIDGTTSTLSCSGSGVVSDPSVGGADVTIVPGQTASVTCRESNGNGPASPTS